MPLVVDVAVNALFDDENRISKVGLIFVVSITSRLFVKMSAMCYVYMFSSIYTLPRGYLNYLK